MFKTYLTKIINKVDLEESEMTDLITELLSGNLTDAQIGAFMAALATKGESFEELAGAAKAMRRKALRIQAPGSVVVDTCGTGGDGTHTFNISTTTAFVVAGCGITVAKHGNRAVTSQCGSADLLEALGVNLEIDPETVEQALREIGIGFLFAPHFHGAMRYAANARKQLGIRSIFNMLGPLCNPAAANYQVLGVYAPQLTEMFAHVLHALGSRRVLVVHGSDGMDEITLTGPTRCAELKDGAVRTYDIDPVRTFGDTCSAAELAGGTPAENAAITRGILDGAIRGPKRDIVLINAAASLLAAGKAETIDDGIAKAAAAIDSGAAAAKLDALIAFAKG